MTSHAQREDIEQKRLLKAEEEAITTKKLNPVLKAELRLKILCNRYAEGKPEIKNLYEPAKSYKLTEEEEEKRERRRLQNRLAAKRCREKRKRKQLEIDEDYDEEFRKNFALEEEVQGLNKTVQAMKTFLEEHVQSSTCVQPVREVPRNLDSSPPDLSNCSFEEVNGPVEELRNVNIQEVSSSHDEALWPTGQDNSDCSLSHIFSDFPDLISNVPNCSEHSQGANALPGIDSFVNGKSYYCL